MCAHIYRKLYNCRLNHLTDPWDTFYVGAVKVIHINCQINYKIQKLYTYILRLQLDILQDSETITNRYIPLKVTARFDSNFTTRHSWNSILNTIRYQLATLLIGGALGSWAWHARANYLGEPIRVRRLSSNYHKLHDKCAWFQQARGASLQILYVYRAWTWTLPYTRLAWVMHQITINCQADWYAAAGSKLRTGLWQRLVFVRCLNVWLSAISTYYISPLYRALRETSFETKTWVEQKLKQKF